MLISRLWLWYFSIRSRKVGGTGLGRAIVKPALDRNNAVIEIVSELDHGSNFTIVFEK